MQHTQIYLAPWREKWWHIACLFGALASGIKKIWKKCQIPEDVRILALFSDLRNSTSKCSELACKVDQPFPTSITQILTAPGWESWVTLRAVLEHLKVEYCRSEKSARFLRISGIWHFFQTLEIPLLSALNWHAKWIDISVSAIHRSSQRLAGRSRFTLYASLEHLKVEYCKSEKNARFLRILGLWHFFRF